MTARRHAERELDRIAAAADHGADAVISFDTQGRVQRWNRSAERLFGYTAEQAQGRTMRELGPAPEGDDRSVRLSAEVLTTRSAVTFDAVRYHRDGTPVDIRVTMVPWEVDGVLVGVTGIAVDVSDRMRAERERERAITDLHEAQRLARVGSWSLDPDTRRMTLVAADVRDLRLSPRAP